MLAILFRMFDDCPVLVAANREERYDRAATPPEQWPGTTSFMAGRDLEAGGTWLGVNERGVLVAITNRPPRHPTPIRSRGLLCGDLLSSYTAREAHERALEELDSRRYAGCNLLLIDAAGGYVVHAGELLRSNPLPPGIHIVTANDLNDSSDARIAAAREQLGAMDAPDVSRSIASIQTLLADHGSNDRPPICLHANDRGTVSSSIIALPRDPRHALWLHTPAAPCKSSYTDESALLRSLLQKRAAPIA